MKKKFLSTNFLTIIAIFFGILVGYLNNSDLNNITSIIAEISVKIMKCAALPLLFLSIISSAAHFKNIDQIKNLGYKIITYTVLTTLIAAVVADILFWVSSSYFLPQSLPHITDQLVENNKSFLLTIMDMIPDNIVKMFLENNVIATVLVAIMIALGLLSINQIGRAHV